MIRSITCTEVYLQQWVAELTMIIAAAIVSNILCVLERRRNPSNNNRVCCAFIIPVNLMEIKGHSSMILATFTLASVRILNVLVWNNAFQFETNSVMLKVLGTLLSIVLISLTFLPLLACITADNVASNISGLLYVMLYTSLAILVITPACALQDMTMFQVSVMIEFNILISISALFLIIRFLLRLLGRSRTSEDILFKIKMEQMQYVKRLLTSRAQSQKDFSLEDNFRPNSFMTRVKLCCQRQMYKEISGFRFSLAILVSVGVGMIAVVLILVVYIASFCDKYGTFRDQVDLWRLNDTYSIPPILKGITNYVLKRRDEAGNPEEVINFIDRQATSIFAAAIISLSLAFLSALYHSMAFVKSYREFKLNLGHRRSLEKMLDLNNLPNAVIVVRAMQFSGFQIAYLMWGYHVQTGFVFLVSMLIIETIILPADSLLAFLLNFLQTITPVAVFIILTAIVQHVLVRRYFLYNNGQTLALKNKKGFLNVLYIMLFFNVFNGVFACMNRFIKWLCTGIWFYLRLDRTTLASSLEKCDLGLVCFASLLKLEDVENNPILHTFLALFSEETFLLRSIKKNSSKNRTNYNKKSLGYKRWFLAWTLMHNKSLKNDRKSHTTIHENNSNI